MVPGAITVFASVLLAPGQVTEQLAQATIKFISSHKCHAAQTYFTH